MEHDKKEATKKQSWIIPITAILIAILLGGSYFASQYYKQKSEERQQQAETKLQQDKLRVEACIERNRLRAERSKSSDEKTLWDYSAPEKCE